MSTTTNKPEITDEDYKAKVNELSSYIYGFLLIAILSAVMLLIHISLSFFFHN